MKKHTRIDRRENSQEQIAPTKHQFVLAKDTYNISHLDFVTRTY